MLDLAGIEQARLLVIASPDGFQARRILELARERNPRIAVVVRTHSSSELAYLIRQGVDRAVMGELELALEMTDYALRSLGVDGGTLEARHAVAAHAGNLTAKVTAPARTARTAQCGSRRRSPTCRKLRFANW